MQKAENFDSEFTADRFKMNLYKDWKDKTIYTIEGPVTDGIRHNIIITIDNDAKYDSVIDYAEWQIRILEDNLKGCILLKKGTTYLHNGSPAYEAVFKWLPTDQLRLYQHQIFILIDGIGYQLTSSFTKKSRKMIGPQVLRMMLSFTPLKK